MSTVGTLQIRNSEAILSGICLIGLIASAFLLGRGLPLYGGTGLLLFGLATIYLQLKQPFPSDVSSLTAMDLLKAGACDDSATGIMITDSEDRVLFTNLAFQKLTGFSADELLGQWPCELFHPLEEDNVRREAVFACASQRLPFSGEIEIRRKDGSLLWIQTDMNPVFDEAGNFIHYVSSNTDISKRKDAERDLEEKEARFRTGMQAIQSGVVLQDAKGQITFCNDQAKEILKIEEGIVGQYSSDPRFTCINSQGSPLGFEDHPCMVCLRTGQPQLNVQLGLTSIGEETSWIAVNAMPVFDASGEITGVVNSLVEITQQLKMQDQIQNQLMELTENQIELELQASQLEQLNAELERLATRDGLTGLFNRRAFDLRLSEVLDTVTDPPAGLVLLDVDHFKPFNDQFGHQAGDHVLREIGSILSADREFVDSSYRYGGEEFAILLAGGTATDFRNVAEKIRIEIQNSNWEHRAVTASMGLAIVTPHTTAHTWLRSADALLYHAKETGRNRVVTNPLSNQDRIAA